MLNAFRFAPGTREYHTLSSFVPLVVSFLSLYKTCRIRFINIAWSILHCKRRAAKCELIFVGGFRKCFTYTGGARGPARLPGFVFELWRGNHVNPSLFARTDRRAAVYYAVAVYRANRISNANHYKVVSITP